MYALRNNDTGKWVAPSGSAKSYTTRDKAKQFPTKEAAEREACDNETAIKLELGWH